LDLVDGAVARAKGMASKKGAYLDTIADRYVEAIGLFGLLFVKLPGLIFPSFVWIFLALLGSMMVTYAKSAAKEKGLSEIDLKGGLMSRAERLFVFLLILALMALGYDLAAIYLLALLALLANITAFQRIFNALTK
jgi:phosphatidylglycerophosphate synthase